MRTTCFVRRASSVVSFHVSPPISSVMAAHVPSGSPSLGRLITQSAARRECEVEQGATEAMPPLVLLNPSPPSGQMQTFVTPPRATLMVRGQAAQGSTESPTYPLLELGSGTLFQGGRGGGSESWLDVQASTESLSAACEGGTSMQLMSSQMASFQQMSSTQLVQSLDQIRSQELLSSNGHPSASEWRSTLVLQEHYWLCPACKVTIAVAISFCMQCGLSRDTASGADFNTQLSAVQKNVHRTAYGRNLMCLTDRAPVHADGSAIAVGADGYRSSVRSELSRFRSRPDELTVQPKPDPVVCGFDGWLCLHSNAAHRFFLKAHVQQFMRSEDGLGEELVSDYLGEWGKRISVPGCIEPVRVARLRAAGLCRVGTIVAHSLLLRRQGTG